jgi:hypothetical protein
MAANGAMTANLAGAKPGQSAQNNKSEAQTTNCRTRASLARQHEKLFDHR